MLSFEQKDIQGSQMPDPAKEISQKYNLQNLPQIPIPQSALKGKYVLVLHDYAPQYSITGIRPMRDYGLLIQCGARVVNAVFMLPFPYSIQKGFNEYVGAPTIVDDNYCLYTVKSVKNGQWIDVQHGFVTDPYDKTFMKYMQDGDRATLNNIIVNEKDATGYWHIDQMNSWFNYEESTNKSARLLLGFDAFVFATTEFNSVSLNLLRYARENMPCYLDSGFRYCYNERCGKRK